MNTSCLQCVHVRLVSVKRGDTYDPMYHCNHLHANETHLMPGKQLQCAEFYGSNIADEPRGLTQAGLKRSNEL